jgi:diamine N-acetyltransferase
MFESPRLKFRAPEPEDIQLLLEWENNPEIWMVSGYHFPYSAAQMKEYIINSKFDIYENKQVRFMLELSDNPQSIVGAVDLFDFDPFHQRAGVGILIGNLAYRKRGYAFEALQLLCNYAFNFLGLHQLYADIPVNNPDSLKLFQKAGFTETGFRKEWLRDGRNWIDILLFQRFNEV